MAEVNMGAGSMMPTQVEAMRPHVLTQFGEYLRAPWDGKNRSRIRPCCDKVVVLVDQIADTAGSIILPDNIKDRTGLAATTGVLVAAGPQAFAYDTHRLVRWEAERPQPGDRVFFQKFAGEVYTGRDGLSYRLMEDRCIGGIEIADEEGAEG